MCDDDNDQEKQAGLGWAGTGQGCCFLLSLPPDCYYSCCCYASAPARSCPQSVCLSLFLSLSLSICLSACPSDSCTRNTNLQNKQRAHSWINGDMLREVSTDCAELGRRKKVAGVAGRSAANPCT